MISVGPRFRASHTKGTLRALERRTPEVTARVLARLEPEVRVGLGEAIPVTFVPAAWDVAVVEAIRAELGAAKTRAVLREMMSASLGGPLLGGLLRSAQALFGASPAGLLKWSGHAYAHVTRECGRVTVEAAAEGTVLLLLHEMPAELATPRYLEAIAGAIEAIFDVCRVADGKVAVWDVQRDGARYQVTWRSARRP